jgi:hypothetical protein
VLRSKIVYGQYYRDKKVVRCLCAFSCAASPGDNADSG